MRDFRAFLSLHPLCSGGDLGPIVYAESGRRRRILFPLSLKNPYSDYFQIFAVCILALGNLPGNFFSAFFSFFNEVQNGRQNPMAHARA